jgi:hypothetical protein
MGLIGNNGTVNSVVKFANEPQETDFVKTTLALILFTTQPVMRSSRQNRFRLGS